MYSSMHQRDIDKAYQEAKDDIDLKWKALEKAKADFEEHKKTAFFEMLKEMKITVITQERGGE